MPIGPPPPPPSAEDKARVAAKAKEAINSFARALNRRSKEDEVAEAHCKLAIASAQTGTKIDASDGLKRLIRERTDLELLRLAREDPPMG
jgi:hypothetical protein